MRVLFVALCIIASPATAGTLYVIDTGVNLSVASRVDFTGGNGYDCHGHGTAMATITRVAPASMVSVRVLDCGGFPTATSVDDGILWVAANAVQGDAVLLAVGSGIWNNSDYTRDHAIEASSANGVSWVVAAGNSADWTFYYTPARMDVAIVVGAADGLNRASYSNYGPQIDLYADGCLSGWCGSSVAAAKVAGDVFGILSVDWWAPPAHVTNLLTGSCQATMITPGPGTTDCKR